MTPPHRLALPLLAVVLATACASPPPREPIAVPASASREFLSSEIGAPRHAVVRASLGVVGTPYRHGGSSPRGFDCSGLVKYSYARAGVAGLPHSAAALAALADPIPLSAVEPGDLLFFELEGKKTSHVAIYVGDRAFVHAPSPGRRVERVSFDDAYWRRKLGRAGRILAH